MDTLPPEISTVATHTRIRVPFFQPIDRILPKILKGFESGAKIVEVAGFPLKVFCVREPGMVAAVLQHKQVGETKLQKLLPRVKNVMRGGGYILAGGPIWHKRRKQVQEGFRREDSRRHAAIIPRITDEMLQRWETHAASNKPFDAAEDLRLLITRLNLNMFLSKDVSGDELKWISDYTFYIELNFVRILPLWLPLPAHFRFHAYSRRLRRFFVNTVKARRSAGGEQRDLISLLLQKVSDATGKPWSDGEIVDELFSVYFGASVMSTTLSWALSLIGSHPHVLEKMRAEISQKLGSRHPTFEDLDELPYADQVVKEVLRLYPPSWGYPRYAESGLEISGYKIPPRSVVIPMILHMHHDGRQWSDPSLFKPERFARAENREACKHAQAAFGIGPRTCLGAGLAPIVMKLILVMLVQRYRLEFCPRFEGDPRIEYGFEMHPRDHIMVRVKK